MPREGDRHTQKGGWGVFLGVHKVDSRDRKSGMKYPIIRV